MSCFWLKKAPFLIIFLFPFTFNSISENINDEKTYKLALNVFNKSYEASIIFDTVKAINYLNQLKEISMLIDNYKVDWLYYYNLSVVNSNLFFDYEKSFINADSALLIARLNDDKKLMIRSYFQISDLFDKINNTTFTLDYANRVSQLLKNKQINLDDIDVFRFYNKLGVIYYWNDEVTKALENFKISLFILMKINPEDLEIKYWFQNILNNIGLCYEELKDYETALKYFKLAVIYSYKLKDKERPLGVNYASIGDNYRDRKQLDLAEKFYLKALKYSLNYQNRELEHGTGTLLNLVKIYIAQNKLQKADSLLKIANRLINTYNIKKHIQVYFKIKSILHDKKGESNLAYQSLFQHSNIIDSINLIVNKNLVNNKLVSLRIENILNEKNNLEYQLKIERNTIFIYRILIVFIFFLSLIIIYLMYKQKKQNRELVLLNKNIQENMLQLENFNKKLNELNIQKTYLVNSVAHDLRSPVGNIQSLINLLDNSEISSKNAEIFDMMKISVKNALYIMEDILDQAQIENGSLELNKNKTNISKLLENTKKILFYLSRTKSIDVKLNITDEIEANIDEIRISRVVQNLLTNAIKFSKSNSSVDINLYKKDSNFILEVIDYGIGISSDKLNDIFLPFIHYNKVGIASNKSYGLGLYITKKIIELHNGSIYVESKFGNGAKFVVSIPING